MGLSSPKSSKYHNGKFVPKFPEKYAGDADKIFFRSSWERTAMVFFDNNPSIIKWASEEIIVPYISPVDGNTHRYYPDFIIKIKTNTGEIKNIMVEIKPLIQCSPPKQGKKKTKRLVEEMKTYSVNQAKWAAATEFCKRNNMTFQVITEKDLFK